MLFYVTSQVNDKAEETKDPEPVSLEPVMKLVGMVIDSPASAAKLLAARKSAGISQKALAIEMGITQPYLSDLEQGNRKWSVQLFFKAKEALGRLQNT